MGYTLYRKMSMLEVENTLRAGKILRPQGLTQLPRKWFSTSLFRVHYFRNPYYNGENAIVKVSVNEKYFNYMLKNGKHLATEPNGFYGVKDYEDRILVAKAHKTIVDLYNIGTLDIDELNEQLDDDILVMDDREYLNNLQEEVLGKEVSSLVSNTLVNEDYDYYLQVPIDVAMLMIKYQTLMVEGINPIIRYLHFMKDENQLERINLNKFKVTLLVKFNKSVKNLAIFNPFKMSIGRNQVENLIKYIEKIEIVRIKDTLDNFDNNFLDVEGDNQYTKHKTNEFEHFNYLSLRDYLAVSKLLIRDDFKLEMVFPYIPELENLRGVMQVDPRNIDALDTHTQKCVVMSNLAINYFKDMGMIIDSNMIMLIKWIMLLHDAGKPYCKGNNLVCRYSQFGGSRGYTDDIIKDLFKGDFQIDLLVLNHLMAIDPESNMKTITKKLDKELEILKQYYQEDDRVVFEHLKRLLEIAFMGKTIHIASLKPRSFCAGYSAEIQLLSKIDKYLLSLNGEALSINYEELYYDNLQAYKRMVEDYYLEEELSTKDMVRKMLQLDYADLRMVYDSKIHHVHHIDDYQQLDYDTLILKYFKDDEELKDYFKEVDKDKKIHGLGHSSRVGVYAYIMGKLMNLDEEEIAILMDASRYHDIGRTHDYDDTEHGAMAIKICESKNLRMAHKDYVYFLIEAHCYDDKMDEEILDKYNIDREKALKLLGIFKDCDALDRVRYDTLNNYGSSLNIKYLRNKEALLLIKFVYLLNATYRYKKKQISPSVYKLLKDN